MAFKRSPLGPQPFGAIISELKIADLGDSETRRALRDAWLDAGVLVFKNMPDDVETQVRLSRVFGDLEFHPIPAGRVEGSKELVQLRNAPDNCDLYEVNGVLRAGYLPWHSDLIYVDRNNRGGILRMIDKPSRNGETGFIDRAQLYDQLSGGIKEKIEGLHVIYKFNPDASEKKFGMKIVKHKLSTMIQSSYRMMDKYGAVIHPIAFEHPEAKKKILNVSPWFAIGIYEMQNEEGDALLEELVSLSESEAFAYYHDWQAGDLVLWDNWRMLHSAYGFPVGDTRTVQRTTIMGDYALGRLMPGHKLETGDRIINI